MYFRPYDNGVIDDSGSCFIQKQGGKWALTIRGEAFGTFRTRAEAEQAANERFSTFQHGTEWDLARLEVLNTAVMAYSVDDMQDSPLEGVQAELRLHNGELIKLNFPPEVAIEFSRRLNTQLLEGLESTLKAVRKTTAEVPA